MNRQILLGVLIPFIGTSVGSACVYFMEDEIKPEVQKGLSGFAAGVMVAASFFSLLLPSIEMASEKLANMSWVPAAVGFIIGILLMLLLDSLVPHQHIGSDVIEGRHSQQLRRTTMMVLAVVIHNIPEGMAVGVSFAGTQSESVSITQAMVLAIGIAIQNFPEGAIISMPLKSAGVNKNKSFMAGVLSGAVEPLAAIITILLSQIMIPILPYLLSFAAGAMFYVVVEELIPEAMGESDSHSNIGTLGFSAGFVIMMILDVMLG